MDEEATTIRKHLLLIVTTLGGDPHAAYRLLRFIQESYDDVTIVIAGQCKSAGTLLAVSGNVLVVDKRADLGPLDIQLRKKDEIGEYASSLTAAAALKALQDQASTMYFRLSSEVMGAADGVSLKFASEAAEKITSGLLGNVYSRVEPLDLGEKYRAVQIGIDYASRANIKFGNLKQSRIRDIVEKYPTHDFVIDCREARVLFNRVREPNDVERALLVALGDVAQHEGKTANVRFLATLPPPVEDADNVAHISPNKNSGA